MGFKYTETALCAVVMALAASCICGCETVKEFFRKDEPIDSSLVAKYWDGPRIGPGMQLVVQLTSATLKPMEMPVMVDQNGEIMLPYLLQEPVACDGLTLEALKQKLVKAYSQFIRQPQIVVTFGAYDKQGVSPWGTVKVMGEVGTQGPVNMPPTMDLTVTKVLQLAGGLRPFADKSRIKVYRCDKDGNQSCTRVDLREIGEKGRFDKDMALKAGDVVFVPETWY